MLPRGLAVPVARFRRPDSHAAQAAHRPARPPQQPAAAAVEQQQRHHHHHFRQSVMEPQNAKSRQAKAVLLSSLAPRGRAGSAVPGVRRGGERARPLRWNGRGARARHVQRKGAPLRRRAGHVPGGRSSQGPGPRYPGQLFRCAVLGRVVLAPVPQSPIRP